MSISKVQFDGNDIINLENDTVTAAVLSAGYTAHNASGDIITGTLEQAYALVLVNYPQNTTLTATNMSGYKDITATQRMYYVATPSGASQSCTFTLTDGTNTRTKTLSGITLASAKTIIMSFIPNEYMECNYLRSNGNQAIDTNFTPAYGDTVSASFVWYSGSVIFGARQGGDPTLYNIVQSNASAMGRLIYIWHDVTPSVLQNIEINYGTNGLVTIRGSWNGDANIGLNNLPSIGISFFDRNLHDSGSALDLLAYTAIDVNGNPKADFRPCYRIADNKPGLYDTVRQYFYTNVKGSDDFSWG